MRTEAAHRFLGAEELAGEIDIDDLLPLVECHIADCGICLNAGVGNQNIDSAELRSHGVEQRLAIAGARDVGLCCSGSAALFLDVADKVLGWTGL